ncbi:MAG: 4-(cytidine 5'-diphospho)-2-C-methyl-D-erythritol kinase [Mediterranea sp.]|jgi:4-diphosphocytidyl-2-C-methyl-D-erythritol kinase|nr:4-(cytidine 5'-diphospho)-2-C-methyl-D-erythritol kinase [Mediterranea sp.]
MLVFPNAKINLGLSITEKRPDGYHNLETVFYPIDGLTDALEVVDATSANNDDIRLHPYGMEVAGLPEENLVVKAYRLLSKEHRLPPVDIHLYKHIPSGAGLGGGSADAAFMLRLLNEQYALGLSAETLEAHAAKLGADCAFFVRNVPVYAEGIGNLFSPIPLSLKDYGVIVVKPNVFVSTKEAFAHIRPHRPEQSVKEVTARPVEEWEGLLVNDFEESVFPQHVQIREIKEELYRQGAVYASMTGSGSSVFGLFTPGTTVPDIHWEADTFCYAGKLLR